MGKARTVNLSIYSAFLEPVHGKSIQPRLKYNHMEISQGFHNIRVTKRNSGVC